MAIDLNNGLVAYYKFSGDYTDETGNYDGTNNGAAITTDKNGVANQAATFEASESDYVDLGAAWGALPGTEFSFSVWCKMPNSGTHATMIGKGTTSSGDSIFYKNSSQEIFWFSRDDAGTFSNLNGGAWPNDVWIHVVVVRRSASLIEMWYNGVLVDTNTNTVTTFTNPHNWSIGAAEAGGTRYFDGEIDELRYYNRALTQEEILALYRGYDAPIPPSAIAMGGGI